MPCKSNTLAPAQLSVLQSERANSDTGHNAMSDLHFRLYQPGDEQAIIALYETTFQQPMSLARWQWQYLQSPTAKTAIMLAFSESGQLAGHYAVNPLPMQVNHQAEEGSLSLDTMVHPDFQGRRLFTSLAQALYEHLESAGNALTYGFPNGNSHHGFVKYLNWQDLAQSIPLYLYPLRFSALLQKAIPIPALTRLAAPLAQLGYKAVRRTHAPSTYHITTTSRFDERVDSLWEKARTLAPTLIRRDRAYLDWRFFQHPDYRYTLFTASLPSQNDQLTGYMVLTEQPLAGLNAGFIVDVLVDPAHPQAANALFKAAIDHSRTAGHDLVNCMIFPHSPYATALNQAGFIRVPPRFFPQEMHLGVRANQPNINGLSPVENWHITWADHDRV